MSTYCLIGWLERLSASNAMTPAETTEVFRLLRAGLRLWNSAEVRRNDMGHHETLMSEVAADEFYRRLRLFESRIRPDFDGVRQRLELIP